MSKVGSDYSSDPAARNWLDSTVRTREKEIADGTAKVLCFEEALKLAIDGPSSMLNEVKKPTAR